MVRRNRQSRPDAHNFGAGPLIFGPAIGFLLVLTVLRRAVPSWLAWSFLPKQICLPAWAVLLTLGLSLYLVALCQLKRATRAGRLATRGLFRCCRHPIYAAWLFFILPGLSFLVGILIAFAVVPYAFLMFRILIPGEQRHLERRFGEAYREYRLRTGALLPRLKKRD